MRNGRVYWDLLKWSAAHADGTRPAPNLSEADRQWFMEAMHAPHMDAIERMKEIALVMQTPEVLGSQGVTADDIEDMLDELQDLVAPIDGAHDFHSIGGLAPLLVYLKNSHANIRAKAADVVATIVQNNPRSQQLVTEANGLEYLLSNFTSDPDVTVRTKALGAISSLIRHNKPGIAAFRLANGYAALKDALSSDSVRFQRKALNLIHYLLHENSCDCEVVKELGFPCIMMHLAASDDALVREAALEGLCELAQDKEDRSGSRLSEYLGKLKPLLEGRINGISLMSPDDLGAAREERQLVDSIWTACFNERSSLCEKGLLVLPGEDAPPPPPDVASRHFERPPRAWAAADANKGSDARKSKPPLLIGPGPPPNAAP